MRIPAHRLALPVLLVATATATSVTAQRTPQSLQSAERTEWWSKIEAIEAMLARQKWKGGLRQAVRITDQAKAEAWSSPDLPRVMAELALQQAIAQINLGRPRKAVWYWYTALNLEPEIAGRDLSAYGLATRLSSIELREAAELPRDFDRLSDLERLQMEPPVFPQVEPPDLVTNAAAALQRQPNLLVEVIVDKTGSLLQPVLLTEDTHPVLVFTAFEWLSDMPPIRPARFDGRPVDSLELFDVGFELERTGGQVFLPPIDIMRPDEPPNDR